MLKQVSQFDNVPDMFIRFNDTVNTIGVILEDR